MGPPLFIRGSSSVHLWVLLCSSVGPTPLIRGSYSVHPWVLLGSSVGPPPFIRGSSSFHPWVLLDSSMGPLFISHRKNAEHRRQYRHTAPPSTGQSVVILLVLHRGEGGGLSRISLHLKGN